MSKMDQDTPFRFFLLENKVHSLSEDTTDEFWAVGKKGLGQNELGQILMEIRVLWDNQDRYKATREDIKRKIPEILWNKQ